MIGEGRRKREEGRRKREEGSSATDYVTDVADVTDVTDVSPSEEGRGKKKALVVGFVSFEILVSAPKV